MAGALAFNVLLGLIPLLVLAIGLTGFVLSRLGDPTGRVLAVLTGALPNVDGLELDTLVAGLTEALLEGRTGYTLAGSAVLLLIATRLSGSVRVTLRETFDLGTKRHPVRGKVVDVVAVVLGFVLLTANVGVTVIVAATVDYSVVLFGIEGPNLTLTHRLLGIVFSFASIWVLLFLVYRYLPARTIDVRTAMVAATFTAVAHEVLKSGFSWYATDVAHWGSTLGNLATVAVFFFWIYYESLVFILGGEVAQVYTMRKASRVGVVRFGDDGQADE